MKRNFTLILLLSIAMVQFTLANPIVKNSMPKPKYKKTILTSKRLMGNPYRDNPLEFDLFSKAFTDTAYTFNGVGCHVIFDSSFSSTADNLGNQLDFNGGGGMGEDLSIIVNGSPWGIRCWNMPTPKDTINLKLVGIQLSTNYQLAINASSYHAPNVIAYVYDHYLKTTTTFSDSSVVMISFTPNPDSIATYQNRFSIIFKSATLPIKNISLTTSLKNSAVNLSWNTTGESNLTNFSIEKSLDGTHFNTINTIAAKNIPSAIYFYTDNSATSGTVYYRIKATSNTGAATYSAVSSINKTIASNSFGVYPNPVRGNAISLKLTNIVSGNYTVNIYSVLGQKVSSQLLQHSGGTATYGLRFNNNIADGLYKLSIVSTIEKKAVYETSLVIKK